MYYKISQLKKMLEAETGENGGYGIHVSCNWASNHIAPINIDAKAVKALIMHYERRIKHDSCRAYNQGAEGTPQESK